MTMQQYLWEYSIPLIKLMSADASHTLYLSENQAKDYDSWLSEHGGVNGYTDPDKLMNDLGLPVFTKK